MLENLHLYAGLEMPQYCPEKMEEVAGKMKAWASYSDSCPHNPNPQKQQKMDGCADGCMDVKL